MHGANKDSNIPFQIETPWGDDAATGLAVCRLCFPVKRLVDRK